MTLLDDDWTYHGNPSTEPRDEVRELVGDIDKHEKLISDSTIALAIETQTSTQMAAAVVARKIAARFAKEATSKSGKDYSRTMARHTAFLQLAEQLRAQDGSAIPSAAQIRRSTTQAIYARGDVRLGHLRIGMFYTSEHDPRNEPTEQTLLDNVENVEDI